MMGRYHLATDLSGEGRAYGNIGVALESLIAQPIERGPRVPQEEVGDRAADWLGIGQSRTAQHY
jgi:hypothetical protein